MLNSPEAGGGLIRAAFPQTQECLETCPAMTRLSKHDRFKNWMLPGRKRGGKESRGVFPKKKDSCRHSSQQEVKVCRPGSLGLLVSASTTY
jgi:hypothetical protein